MFECMSISGVLIHVRMHENFRCFNSCMNTCKLIFNSCMNACKLIFDSCMNAWKIDLMNFLFLFFIFIIIFLCLHVWMKCNFRKCIIFWNTTLIVLIFYFLFIILSCCKSNISSVVIEFIEIRWYLFKFFLTFNKS